MTNVSHISVKSSGRMVSSVASVSIVKVSKEEPGTIENAKSATMTNPALPILCFTN